MILNMRQRIKSGRVSSEPIGASKRVTCLVFRDEILHHKFIGPESELRMHLKAMVGQDGFAEWRYELAA